MLENNHYAAAASKEASIIQTNKVLKNTYMLLGMTLLFSAISSSVAIATQIHVPFLVYLIGLIGLLFGIHKARNSALALPLTFAFTGFIGFCTGPVIGAYLSLPNGAELVASAMGTTALVFFGLSGYVLTTKKDFSFLGGFLFAGIMVAFVTTLIALGMSYFFQYSIPGLHLAISAIMVLLLSGYILYDTSNIINGGETNYVMATVSLYINIWFLFMNLLHLFGFMSGDD